MVLLHSKVTLYVQQDLLVAVVQVILHTLCVTLTQFRLLLARMHNEHKCSAWHGIRAAGRVPLALHSHGISRQQSPELCLHITDSAR